MRCVYGEVVNGWLKGNSGDYEIVNLRCCPTNRLAFFLIRPGLKNKWVVEFFICIKSKPAGV